MNPLLITHTIQAIHAYKIKVRKRFFDKIPKTDMQQMLVGDTRIVSYRVSLAQYSNTYCIVSQLPILSSIRNHTQAAAI